MSPGKKHHSDLIFGQTVSYRGRKNPVTVVVLKKTNKIFD